ncbi:MAG: restriction endonuclease subunit S [Bacteroidales bacterium]|nr:restriction endonuclease subunit S [Bacteroidales bacterium]
MIAQSLKKSILQEAISGRLVPQIESEGTAEELVSCPEIPDDEQPFKIPSSWKWVRLGDIFAHNTGKTMNSNTNTNKTKGVNMKFITTSNVYWNSFDFSSVKEMFFSDSELDRNTLRKGDLVVCEGGAYYGRTAIWNYDYSIGFQNHLHRLRALVPLETKYFYYVMYLYKNSGRIECVGAAMPALSSKALHIIPLPLPPLSEQRRIVTKLETLLPKIDSLEKTEIRLSLLESTLGERLWKSVLQEAISGRLTTQQPSDGSADDLLEQIKAAHREAFATTQKKYKPLTFSPIPDSEIPFDIPENWRWVRLGEIGEIVTGSTPSKSNPEFYGNDFPFYKPSDMDNGMEINSSLDGLSKEGLQKSRFLKKYSVLVTCIGSVGKTSIITREGACNQQINAIMPLGSVSSYYLYYVMISSEIQSILKMNASATTLPILNKQKFSLIPFPLPPLSEQLRIVSKLEKMRSVLDKRG